MTNEQETWSLLSLCTRHLRHTYNKAVVGEVVRPLTSNIEVQIPYHNVKTIPHTCKSSAFEEVEVLST